MRAVVQRVASATVAIHGETVGAIGPGLLILVGIAPEDTVADADWLAGKLARLRIFTDDDGRMNRDVQQIGGGLLVISQFTLFADVRSGNRPSFTGAAPPAVAIPLYEAFLAALARHAPACPLASGRFGADMQVSLVNDGPVTIVV